MTERHFTPMVRYLVWAMEGRGIMTNDMIYRAVDKECRQFGRALPNEWEAEIRQTLQAHCPSRPQWNKKDDFFVYHRRGHWSCKVTTPKLEDLLRD
jgi:hypothetical protein